MSARRVGRPHSHTDAEPYREKNFGRPPRVPRTLGRYVPIYMFLYIYIYIHVYIRRARAFTTSVLLTLVSSRQTSCTYKIQSYVYMYIYIYNSGHLNRDSRRWRAAQSGPKRKKKKLKTGVFRKNLLFNVDTYVSVKIKILEKM